MLSLAIPTFLRNAASALLGQQGAVSEQARRVGCSRQTIYNDKQQVCDRLEQRDRQFEQLRAECAQLRQEKQRLLDEARLSVLIDDDALKRFAVTAQAVGVSLRQAEVLLGTLLPDDRVPDHSTMGHWTKQAGTRAGEVLAVLDPLAASLVETACIDEIFFGGSRPWWWSSRRAWRWFMGP
jgi:hypothetical protein